MRLPLTRCIVEDFCARISRPACRIDRTLSSGIATQKKRTIRVTSNKHEKEWNENALEFIRCSNQV